MKRSNRVLRDFRVNYFGVDKVVSSDPRGPGFKSSQRQFLRKSISCDVVKRQKIQKLRSRIPYNKDSSENLKGQV